jgi:hypothetical protein
MRTATRNNGDELQPTGRDKPIKHNREGFLKMWKKVMYAATPWQFLEA